MNQNIEREIFQRKLDRQKFKEAVAMAVGVVAAILIYAITK
jgi:hypothetical protein